MVFYPPITLFDAEMRGMRSWIENNYSSDFFQDAGMSGNRVTTRHTDKNKFCFPEFAYQVRTRISHVLGFSLVPTPSFKNGMVASYAKPGDTCYAHKDPRWYASLFTVHCNVIVAAPDSGGELVVEGKEYEMPEGKFICYPVSEVEHETLLVKGDRPRLMWVFGFCVKPDQYLETARRFQ